MKLRKIVVAATVALAGTASLVSTAALAQAKEQYLPVLSYRTGAYAPNGTPTANGIVDYYKLVNARGGINGVKLLVEECETMYDTARSVECYERLKGKNGGAALIHPWSTGATFALTEKAPVDKIPLITTGYGRSNGLFIVPHFVKCLKTLRSGSRKKPDTGDLFGRRRRSPVGPADRSRESDTARVERLALRAAILP